jgi:hypothetical protein
MVVLFEAGADGFSVRPDQVSQLARLGVSNLALLRDRDTIGVVLEGWLFDPARSAAAAVSGLSTGARALHPLFEMAVSSTSVVEVADTYGKE